MVCMPLKGIFLRTCLWWSRLPSSNYGHVTADCVTHSWLFMWVRPDMSLPTASHTVDCSCESGSQTPEHVVQSCPLYKEARTQHWPQVATLAERLWGSKEGLLQAASFSSTITLDVRGRSWSADEEQEGGVFNVRCIYSHARWELT